MWDKPTSHAHTKSSVRLYHAQYLHQQCKEKSQKEIRLRHFEKANIAPRLSKTHLFYSYSNNKQCGHL